ncbi:MAG: hypothetical protein SX243_05635 [Acidobacteriota bacterium]|nr:hypothetical protein [Acidobacteriota bacterium]
MKKLFYALAVLTLVAGSMSVMAAEGAAAQSAAATPDSPASQQSLSQQAASQEPIAQGSISGSAGGAQEAGIFCAITCDDGTGLAYICKLGSFPDCCQIGEDACWSYHGGVDEGSCWQGSVNYTCDGI